MDRRRFLKKMVKIAGWSLGVSLAGVGGGLLYVQPRRYLWPLPDDNAQKPRSLGAGKAGRVVIVGGGLAGLVTGIELAERHFAVTLVESAGHLGGKVGGWQVKALGETFHVEHGFHGFFAQYYNLREVLDAAGAYGELIESPGYPVLFHDRPTETFGRTSTVFPLNLLSVVRTSKTLKFNDFRHDGPALYDLMKYDGEKTFAKFDSTDFLSFAKNGRIHQEMVDTILDPFGQTTLNRCDALSAAEAIRFFHFYFIGNPDGLTYRYTPKDSMTSIVGPLQRRFESLGGVVRLGTPARRVVVDGGRVTQVVVAGEVAPAAKTRLPASSVSPSGWCSAQASDGTPIFLRRHSDGKMTALDARCTHMGCPVHLAPDGNGFQCPCHGGKFDDTGQPIWGPPKRALGSLPVVVDRDEIVIGGDSGREESLPCDFAVVACDVRGVRQLLDDDRLGAPTLQRGVRALGEADPYVVLRLWLDKPTKPQAYNFFTCSRYRYLDSLALYHDLQQPYIEWAKRTGGSVVELHSYAIPPDRMVAPARIQAALLDDMYEVLPELIGAKILHQEYQQQSNFSRFAPGDHALRPSTETEIGNLFVAGDHVKLPLPASLMEAAAMSGRFAANAILRQSGLQQITITSVAKKGPLA